MRIEFAVFDAEICGQEKGHLYLLNPCHIPTVLHLKEILTFQLNIVTVYSVIPQVDHSSYLPPAVLQMELRQELPNMLLEEKLSLEKAETFSLNDPRLELPFIVESRIRGGSKVPFCYSNSLRILD